MKVFSVRLNLGFFLLTLGHLNLLNGECVIEPGFEFPAGYECLIPGGKMTFDGSSLKTSSECGTKWSTATSIRGKRALFQKDGNLVVYDGAGGGAAAVFATFTFDQAKKLVLKDDGNLVMLGSSNNTIWETGPFDECTRPTEKPCPDYDYKHRHHHHKGILDIEV